MVLFNKLPISFCIVIFNVRFKSQFGNEQDPSAIHHVNSYARIQPAGYRKLKPIKQDEKFNFLDDGSYTKRICTRDHLWCDI
ncbi:hypothetical protein WA026_010977 [Henosepilachna vigintioctopunctata]|uniref:Uncharacterized protein n=1 Tax=Henosepilachna vigintioctopunctata TaxID=420089 RepID=A0AAW1UZV3_9CUCU